MKDTYYEFDKKVYWNCYAYMYLKGIYILFSYKVTLF